MKKQDEIEELFSSSFEGFEKIPPMDLKASIDEKIFNGENTSVRRRRGFFWFLTLILLPGVTLFFGLIDFNEVRGMKAQHSENNSKSKWQIVKQKQRDLLTEKENSFGYSRKSVSKENYLFGFNFLLNEIKITDETSDYLNENPTIVIGTGTNKESFNSRKKTTGIKSKSTISPKHWKHKKKSNLKLTNSYDYTNFPDLRKPRTKKISNINAISRIDKTEFIETNETTIFVEEEVQSFQTREIENIKEEKLLTNEQIGQKEDKDSDSTKQKDPFDVPSLTQSENPDSLIPSPWVFSLYAGATFGINSLKNSSASDYHLKEQLGFSTNLEVNYSLNSKFGINSGIDFASRNDIFYKTTQSEDSVLTGFKVGYVYDPINKDSIIDTIMYANYEVQSTEIQESQLIHHTSIAIPIAFGWTFYNKGKWSMKLNTGLRFAYVQSTLLFNDLTVEPFMGNFELRCNLRPQLIYTENKIGIGLYMNFGYDIIPSITWSGPNIYLQRNRFDLGAGVVLRYHL